MSPRSDGPTLPPKTTPSEWIGGLLLRQSHIDYFLVQSELRRLSDNKACCALRFSDARWWPRTDVSASCQDFLRALLNADPRQRFTAAQALAHPWCSDFVEDSLG
mmetsp:Transcript_55941/g.128388  ORF Transcript_55941/g.128388 Transcript_55941/m.128388 type:complete len:105 (+) Transcript_55941:1240-1554(+)